MSFPLTGKKYRIDYGDFVFDYECDSEGKKLAFTAVGGMVAGHTETVDVDVTGIRDDVFAVTFVDSYDGRVISVLDLSNNAVHSYVSMPENRFFTMKGVLTVE